jgi:hypothetical protein
MPLKYDPQHVIGWIPKPGEYTFRILSCTEVVFRTGSEGIRLHLEIDAGAPVPLTGWENIVFGERSTWKMHDLCRATGVRFDPPCEAADLVGTTGRAEFSTAERGGFVELTVLRYLPKT